MRETRSFYTGFMLYSGIHYRLAGVWYRCTGSFCFNPFRTENFARTQRRARDSATPNAAPIQARALPTSDVSRSARSVNKMHVERAARQNRENFARNSSVADANFARERRQTHNFFDTKHAANPSKHSADVVSLSQRRRPKCRRAQHQERNRSVDCRLFQLVCNQERWTFQVEIKLKFILKYDNLC